MGTDPEVMGLWAGIEKAVYDGLESGKANGHHDAPTKAGLDGYHQEFVANLER